MTLGDDAFHDIAPYYDAIMRHVSYPRWEFITRGLAQMLPDDFVHLDVACGTGRLVKQLGATGWKSIGVDLSFHMTRTGRDCARPPALAVADMRALPMAGSVHYVTCLFDSLNFLLQIEDVSRFLKEVARALKRGGIVYFDVVTERMVLDHFADQEWTEDNEGFATTWSSVYDAHSRVAATRVATDSGAACVIQERVYSQSEIEKALAQAGLSVLGRYDGETWKRPKRRSLRVEYVAVKGPTQPYRRAFKAIRRQIVDVL